MATAAQVKRKLKKLLRKQKKMNIKFENAEYKRDMTESRGAYNACNRKVKVIDKRLQKIEDRVHHTKIQLKEVKNKRK